MMQQHEGWTESWNNHEELLSIGFTELELLRSQATCWSLPFKVAGQGGNWAGGKVYMMDCSSGKSEPHCSASFVSQITLSKQPAVLGNCSNLKQIFDCKLMYMLGETKLLPQRFICGSSLVSRGMYIMIMLENPSNLPLPEHGRCESPWHFLRLSSGEIGQEVGCSHFFPVHPVLQSHRPQLHWPWP